MKVENLIKVLQETQNPSDDICVLWWEKPEELSAENWAEICSEFDEWDGGADINDWIADAIAERNGMGEDY